jgi:chemotaxis protein methyltransferase CheR
MEFELISRLAYTEIGLSLRDGKQSLVITRLGKRLRSLGLASYQEYYEHVIGDRSGAALADMIDLLTTNHTSFFREPAHFDYLRETILPAIRSRSQVEIWSAACASGEEAFSIAMTVLEACGQEFGARLKVRATDISTRAVEQGRAGVYSAQRFQALPAELVRRYLLKGQNAAADQYRFKESVRGVIEFEQGNLLEERPGGCYPVIFCRNLLIYFDRLKQEQLIRQMTLHLEEGGYLFIGHSESLNGISHDLEYVCPATYRKSRWGAVAANGKAACASGITARLR